MSMRTSKPISTISYNSPEFLEHQLNKLLKEHTVSYWCYIKHIGEELDDGTKEKDHIHLYIEPNKLMDTMKLGEEFIETVAGSIKPLKCISFRFTKEVDWIWYCQHEPFYLARKGEFRIYQYGKNDFRFSDEDEFGERYNSAMHNADILKDFVVAEKLRQGSTISDMVVQGLIPPHQAYAYKTYGELFNDGLKRINGEKQRMQELNDN